MSYLFNKKSYLRWNWKKSGVNFTEEEFQFLWGVYESIDKCMLCSKHLIGSDKCLDHNHVTGEVRYILCNKCNSSYCREKNKNNKSGYQNIHTEKRDSYEFWIILIRRNGKKIVRKSFSKKKWSLEQVVQIRDKIIADLNIQYAS